MFRLDLILKDRNLPIINTAMPCNDRCDVAIKLFQKKVKFDDEDDNDNFNDNHQITPHLIPNSKMVEVR